MPKQLLFYELATPVSVERHQSWSLTIHDRYPFAAAANAAPVMISEFPAAAPCCPIVFSAQDGVVMPVVVFGVESGRNLFVDSEGRWTSPFVPAFVRRYPFVFSLSQDRRSMTLCVDEAFPGIDRSGKTGERLFDDSGQRSPFLERALAFSTAYQQEHERTRRFAERLQTLGLLEPARATLGSGEESRQITGFHRVSREKLALIPQDALAELFSFGMLELIYLHLLSLGAFAELHRRDRERLAAPDGAARA